MKKRIFVIFLLLVATLILTLSGKSVALAESRSLESLTITGTSCISVEPDRAKISAEIQTLDIDKTKSNEDNFEIFENLISVLESNGLTKDDITLDYFTSYASYDYNNGKTLLGYYTLTDFSIQLNSLNEIKDYVSLLSENGVTSIKSITYSASNFENKYNEAVLGAIENAKEKAKVLGYENLELKEIKEESVYSSSSFSSAYNKGTFDILGKITISAKVVAIFK